MSFKFWPSSQKCALLFPLEKLMRPQLRFLCVGLFLLGISLLKQSTSDWQWWQLNVFPFLGFLHFSPNLFHCVYCHSYMGLTDSLRSIEKQRPCVQIFHFACREWNNQRCFCYWYFWRKLIIPYASIRPLKIDVLQSYFMVFI